MVKLIEETMKSGAGRLGRALSGKGLEIYRDCGLNACAAPFRRGGDISDFAPCAPNHYLVRVSSRGE